ncbi:MAG: DUF3090 family protein [Chloroflexi bacterium]|nr:DUF3090 family protein [Chloroflexota bacterium]MDA1175093.1 DUF3090 family protein [Chloroflexota bacterium]
MSADDQAHARHDLGLCRVFEAESVGPPGQRFFRLRATAEHGTALIWIEKEHLSELAHTVKRTLRTSVKPSFPPQPLNPDDFLVDFDFKVVSIALGHDRASQRYMLLAQVSEEEDDAIVLWLEADTLDRMADQALDAHDAGRPRCPLCGAADPDVDGRRHVCPRAN